MVRRRERGGVTVSSSDNSLAVTERLGIGCMQMAVCIIRKGRNGPAGAAVVGWPDLGRVRFCVVATAVRGLQL